MAIPFAHSAVLLIAAIAAAVPAPGEANASDEAGLDSDSSPDPPELFADADDVAPPASEGAPKVAETAEDTAGAETAAEADPADAAAEAETEAEPPEPQQLFAGAAHRVDLVNPSDAWREFALFVDVGQPCTLTVETSANGECWLPATSKADVHLIQSGRVALRHLFKHVRATVQLDEPTIGGKPVCVLLLSQTPFRLVGRG